MFEVRDIKLFGKTIEAAQSASDATGEDSSNQDPPCSSNHFMLEDSNNLNNDADEQESPKSPSSPKQDDAKEQNLPESLTSEELKDSNTIPPIAEDSKAEEDQSDSQDKTLKKPDKIIPCPRCNSMETKFCYFNNYNVSQPRHFCKKCQRYWTAGGTMRNVPVGAGRRKNKNAARHLTCPESVRIDLVNGAHHPNGTVLTFTSDAPLCESMVSVLDSADKTVRNGSISCKENGDDHSTERKNGSPETIPKCHPFPQQVPVFPGAPWPYPWNFGPSGFPLPFYSTPPPPYWPYALPGSWNIPWIVPQTCPTSGLNPPSLGKHSRDENVLKSVNNPEKRLWVPKTLRIDDPEEAAKSSIWATLGIKHDRVDSIGGGGLFKAFESQSKYEKKVPEASTVLQANPAALSRSLNFHESS